LEDIAKLLQKGLYIPPRMGDYMLIKAHESVPENRDMKKK
jgi:hypothetical protein